ncbi:hypothetical protein [Chryseobacterium sp. SORGH_AS_0447]|uniref:hypothetical protein n=1 Tax=Chryseobacterium sp. SORGH_AS_0447 TaxID=3041769 RepID=UPI0027D858B5|nr:hypothetical protein [Chryseobacterium sp. SORGH_AS_0447]
MLQLADHFINRNYRQSLADATKASKIAEKDENSSKKAWSYYYIAKSLIFLKEFRKSTYYINKGLREESAEQDPILKAALLHLKIGIYSRLKMNKLMHEESMKILDLLNANTSTEGLVIKAKTLYGLSLITDHQKESDKLAYEAQTILKHIPDSQYNAIKETFKFKAYFYNFRGEVFLERKMPDSAQYYLFKAYHYSKIEGFIAKNTFYASIGNLYSQKKDNRKALIYYLKALDDIDAYDKNAFAKNGPGLLKKIYTIYQYFGDEKKYKYYYDRYRIANEQHLQHIDDEVLTTANEITHEKVSAEKARTQTQDVIIILILVSAISAIIFLWWRNKKIQQKKDLLIRHRETTLLETEQKATALSLKVEDALIDVIEAAKNNLQEFWPMFQKLYPDFSGKILSVNPDIRTSELVLCAYAFLGFTTKDIAVYTFKAVQTVKNNKHNLRKRLQIPPKQDLNVWLRDFYQN